ncbi:ferrochelatase [Helicobacter felis]|uniref:ferrochelatase n=1 Tax=Helicobacter felis TaxID=214 RepID=UPI000CF1C464|nr:ferrochelatase [Helicobacter felis]
MLPSSPKEAVVLLNMGGPNHLDEVALFLTNMFNDPYILSINPPKLRKLLARFITNNRLQKSQAIYQRIGGKSPIATLSAKLVAKLNALDPSRYYTYAMRYTPPFAHHTFQTLKDRGFERLKLFSMYPQYSTTTTLSSMQDALRALETLNYTPHMARIERFYTHALYNQAILESIANTLVKRPAKDFVLIFSVHGLPTKVVLEGDPYQAECLHHVSLLKRAFVRTSLRFKEVVLAYQSKVGPMKWLEPSTEAMIEKYRQHKIIIYPLAFSIDNSETLYELQIQYKFHAMRLGVPEYLVCPCLNDQSSFARAIIDILNTSPAPLNQEFTPQDYNESLSH